MPGLREILSLRRHRFFPDGPGPQPDRRLSDSGSGFQIFDARQKPEYGYGRYPNVITSLEFERLLSATGPTNAHIKRPSDGAEPEKIAWIQCVGSRDAAYGRPYCSSVCCMYATKQAIIAQEHDAKIEPTIFFIDLRAHRKGFESYYQRAKVHHHIRYMRATVSRVMQETRATVIWN